MNIVQSVKNFFISTREELRKVAWPSREQTTRYTIYVIVSSIVAAAFFAALDYGFTELVRISTPQPSAAPTEQLPTPIDATVTPDAVAPTEAPLVLPTSTTIPSKP